METRVAIISIIVEDTREIEQLNRLLTEYRDYVIGRMGLPYPKRDINIICIAMDAPQDTINALTGQLSRLEGITAKANFSKH